MRQDGVYYVCYRVKVVFEAYENNAVKTADFT